MLSTESLRHWLRLTLVPGIGSETQRKLLQRFGLPELVFSTSRSELRDVIGDRLASALLETDTDTLKARMKSLGYGSIPGKPAERVAAYRKLRADLGAADDIMAVAAQPALVTVDATQPGREYQD